MTGRYPTRTGFAFAPMPAGLGSMVSRIAAVMDRQLPPSKFYPEVNAPFRGWKITQFEGGIRVPLFIKWPGRIPAGTESQTPVAHIDMLPTLLAAAGESLPDGVVIDGENLLPLATGEGDAAWARETLFWQAGHYRVVRHGDWKLQVAQRPDTSWLFNLAEDPTEQHNLAATRPDKLAELKALLDAHQAASRPPCMRRNLKRRSPSTSTWLSPLSQETSMSTCPTELVSRTAGFCSLHH